MSSRATFGTMPKAFGLPFGSFTGNTSCSDRSILHVDFYFVWVMREQGLNNNAVTKRSTDQQWKGFFPSHPKGRGATI